MAIVTRDEVKEFNQITGATYDDLIDALIPQAEGLYLQKRGIDFFVFNGDTTDATAVIDDINDKNEFHYIKRNKVIENIENDIRDSIILIDDSEITVSGNITGTYEDIEFIIYPYGSQLVASKIVDYFLSKDSSNGYKSENIGNYSYNKFDSVTGLPEDIVRNIEEYHTTWQ